MRGTGRASWLSTSAVARSTASSMSCSSTSSAVSLVRWYSSYGKWRTLTAGIFSAANGAWSVPASSLSSVETS